MNDITSATWIIIEIRRYIMGNIISILQEIFMLKEDNSTKVGLSDFRETSTPVERPIK